MLGILTENQMEQMLQNEALGRIGCSLEGKIYVLPVNYGYDGKAIYIHSKEGLKIKIMRKNKDVCFEVDRWERSGGWKSVIVWGKYEELKTVKEQNVAMKIYSKQITRLIPDKNAWPSHGISKGLGKDNDPFKSVVFKIVIDEKSGKYESR